MKTSSAEAAPPRVEFPGPAAKSSAGALAPVWLLLGLAALALAARFALAWQLPLPQCWLRKLTDVPCPSCGCTRSLAAWATLDVEQAFRFNPLFFLLCIAALAWAIWWLAEKAARQTFFDGLQSRVLGWPWWPIGAALVALNWLYLCLTLPK
jgi:hypothetical protein